jgi:hypothetical protein
MPNDTPKLVEGYSIVKGLKGAFVKTVIPAVGLAVVGLLGDPEFVSTVQQHLGTVAGGGVLSFAFLLAVNWAKNRGK